MFELNYAHLLPPLYANYFVLNAEVYDYNTRASTDLHVLGPRSTFGQRCIRHKEVCDGIVYLLD